MKRVLALIVVSVLMSTGCQTWPWQQKSPEPVAQLDSADTAPGTTETTAVPEPGLALAPEQRFSDVPLPVGVVEDAERSFVYESSTLQIGRMVYTSKAAVNDVAQFYIRECPTTGWQLKEVTQAEGTRLIFKKQEKQLVISISNLGVGRGRQLVLLLTPDS